MDVRFYFSCVLGGKNLYVIAVSGIRGRLNRLPAACCGDMVSFVRIGTYVQNCVVSVSCIAVFRIRTGSRSGFNRVSDTGSRRAEITLKIEKNQEISCFEVLDVLF